MIQTASETWFRVASVPLRWENGQVQEALGLFLDVDAEKRLLNIQHQINAGLEQRVREEMAAREAAQKRAAHAERMHALGRSPVASHMTSTTCCRRYRAARR